MTDGDVKESIQSFFKTLMYQQWQNHMEISILSLLFSSNFFKYI